MLPLMVLRGICGWATSLFVSHQVYFTFWLFIKFFNYQLTLLLAAAAVAVLVIVTDNNKWWPLDNFYFAEFHCRHWQLDCGWSALSGQCIPCFQSIVSLKTFVFSYLDEGIGYIFKFLEFQLLSSLWTCYISRLNWCYQKLVLVNCQNYITRNIMLHSFKFLWVSEAI